jgi:uncharacterized membrane protein
MSFDLIKYILLISYAFGGFLIAYYIHNKKKTGAPLVCPLRAKCHVVIHSEYSKFLNIPIEWMGMGYYLMLALAYLLLFLFPSLGHPTVFFALVFMTTCAFTFSLYLTCVQIFAIKQFCSWCLLSALLCFMIFSVTAVSPPMGIDIVLSFHYQFLLALHVTGIIFGVGGATITAIFFFKFLKDSKIDLFESDILSTLTEVMWVGTVVTIISQIGLFLPQREILLHSSAFLLTVTGILFVLINMIFATVYIASRIKTFSLVQSPEGSSPTTLSIRRIIFVSGSLSLVSWYVILFLNVLDDLVTPFTFSTLLLGYILLLFITGMAALVLERLFSKGIKLVSM